MGLYILDKPTGISSNRALSEFKHKNNISKVGFSGVLDPFASGLLIIATGAHTRLLDIFLNQEKTYRGKILFGKTTDTLDTEGKITSEADNVELTIKDIRAEIKKSFLGDIKQTPPIYSNIKVNGKRARELALKGKEVKLKPKDRTIYSFEIKSFGNNEAEFKVKVSSGTYIRQLAFDLGKELGYPAMLLELRRTKIGNIKVGNKKLVPYKAAGLKTLKITKEQETDLLNGKKVDLSVNIKELVVLSEESDLWVKKSENGYKIHKRLR